MLETFCLDQCKAVLEGSKTSSFEIHWGYNLCVRLGWGWKTGAGGGEDDLGMGEEYEAAWVGAVGRRSGGAEGRR